MQYLNNTQNQVINEKNTTAWYLIAKWSPVSEIGIMILSV